MIFFAALNVLAVMLSMLGVGAQTIRLVDIDDTQTPPIVYTGSWTPVTDFTLNGANTTYWDGTTTNTITPGDHASFTFIGGFQLLILPLQRTLS